MNRSCDVGIPDKDAGFRGSGVRVLEDFPVGESDNFVFNGIRFLYQNNVNRMVLASLD